ncbi:protein of unknown function [Pricia antarctica]|uniref:DUF4249 domain-containing protein n=1 Tax=Pricia antarctica TaxID=641691 RepID=A0A1G7EIP3_9FLAO|nr:DUF4249 domain-containing protein [Pricia antarctica]SDE63551.1 protein of unknown function [Pricia antarctica]
MPARSYRKYRRKKGVYLLFILSLLHSGCVEEFQPDTEFFESALVIESVVTDEVKPQEIVLSRTFRFEENNPQPEQNAKVSIIDNDEIEYAFTEVEPGRYLSTDAFGAIPEKEYRLNIETDDGTRYNSDASKLTGAADIQEVYAVAATNLNNVEGVSLRIDTFDPTGNSRYYRFDYEESYKIIAPKWVNVDAVFENGALSFQPKTREQQTCYNTVLSNTINLASTNGRVEDRLTGFPLRFIEKDNYIIAHRYSILVHQYVISPEAFSYYTYLADLSTSGSLFSESQPGFLAGNIFSDNGSEKVLGYFEVSSSTSKRIFFNHRDLFPDDFSLSYPNSCEVAKPESLVAIPLLESGDAKFFGYNVEPGQYEGPYVLVSRVCGDCRVLGDNVVPDFWEE